MLATIIILVILILGIGIIARILCAPIVFVKALCLLCAGYVIGLVISHYNGDKIPVTSITDERIPNTETYDEVTDIMGLPAKLGSVIPKCNVKTVKLTVATLLGIVGDKPKYIVIGNTCTNLPTNKEWITLTDYTIIRGSPYYNDA